MQLFSKLVIATMPIIPKAIIKTVARRYIAGPFLNDAVRVTQSLMKIGASSTIDVLGEFVTSRERADHEAQMSGEVVDAIHGHQLDAYLSVKLTSLGLDIDPDFAFERLVAIVDRARHNGVLVRMDMENTPYTEQTLQFYERLRLMGYDNIGVVIQAYLRRSEADVLRLLPLKPNVRLCKGIYVEDEEHAFKDADEIRANYRKLLSMLLDGGADVRIATHDEALIKNAIAQIAERKRQASTVEFQMLLGVREERRDQLIAAGFKMRIYVPFGEDWYGYSTRRLKENPQIAGHIGKAVLTGGS